MSVALEGGLELVGIRQSSYTEKARWALDYHQKPYRFREHLILLGDPFLEFRVKRAGAELPVEGVTVPILFGQSEVIFDSFEILRRVDESVAQGGRGRSESPLIPPGSLPEVKHFNLLADTISNAGRALYMERLAASEEGQRASLPGWIPRRPAWIRGSCLPLVRSGMKSIDDQFKIHKKSPGEHSHHLLQCLVGLRSHREHSGAGDFLLGSRFTAADLVVASSLAVLRPPAFLESRMDPALFALWTHPDFSREFTDLLEWRDRVYAAQRKV